MNSLRRIAAVARVSLLELFRRRDVYVALILALVIVVPLSCINLFGITGIVRYVREVALLLIWLFSFVICIGNAARQIPGELQRRTILPLLAKPISRLEVVLGKYVGATVSSGAAVLLFYACYVLLVGIVTGDWFSWVLVQALVMHMVFVAFVTALVLFGSLLLTPSANLTCSTLIVLGMLLFGRLLSGLALHGRGVASGVLWFFHFTMPHVEFFDFRLRVVHGWEPVSLAVLGAVMLYAGLYTAALLWGAAVAFRRKRL